MSEVIHQDEMSRTHLIRLSLREAWRSAKEVVGIAVGVTVVGAVSWAGYTGLDMVTDAISPDSEPDIEAPEAHEPYQGELLDDAWAPLTGFLVAHDRAESVTTEPPRLENGAIQWGFSDVLPDGTEITVSLHDIPYEGEVGEFIDLTIGAHGGAGPEMTVDAQDELRERLAGVESIELHEKRPDGQTLRLELGRDPLDGGITGLWEEQDGLLVESGMPSNTEDRTGMILAEPSRVVTGLVTGQIEIDLDAAVAE